MMDDSRAPGSRLGHPTYDSRREADRAGRRPLSQTSVMPLAIGLLVAWTAFSVPSLLSRRRHHRHPAGEATVAVDGHLSRVVNVSANRGLFLVSQDSLRVDDVVDVEVWLPGDSNSVARGRLIVTHVGPDKDSPGLHRVGGRIEWDRPINWGEVITR